MCFFNKIFSVNKEKRHCVITILGVKLKFKSKINDSKDNLKIMNKNTNQTLKIERICKKILNLLDSRDKEITKTFKYLVRYSENTHIKNFWNDIDFKNYEKIYKNLIKNLDEKSIDCVSKILSRIQLVANGNEKCYDIWTNEELAQLRNLNKDFHMNIIQLSDSCWAYKNYFLPKNMFSPSVFYYKHEIDSLENIAGVRNKCIMDVGGYLGDSALVLSKYTDKQIYSFEPVTENYNYLLKTIELNNLKNVVPVKYGLGAEESELQIFLQGGGSSIGRIIKENPEKETIKITTLDKFVEENNIEVGLIKVDIEGFEQQFLKGAENTIKTQKPTLLLSIYHNANDFFQIKPYIESLDLGYKLKIRKPTDGHIRGEILLLAEQGK